MRGVSKRSLRIVETMCVEEVECSDVVIVQIKYLWNMLKGAKDLFKRPGKWLEDNSECRVRK